METPATVTIEQRPEGSVAVLTGDWTATELHHAVEDLREVMQARPDLGLDLGGIGRCDTSGAFAILEAAHDRLPRDQIKARPEIARLLELVAKASEAEPTPPREHRPALAMFDRIGRGLVNVGFDFYDTMAFNGRLIVTTGRALINPRRLRWAAVVAQVERAGLDAIPIVGITAFFIGAVVAFIGANMLSDFGAQVFSVELIGIAILREFAIVITAVLLAGRSASSFAAEIGSMKMSQEIDAMNVLGVDPFEALVLPRFLALLFTIPLLTFVAMLAGLFGGLIVCWSSLDLSPTFFIQRLVTNVGAHQFWIGMSKAPVLAIVIAAIGCRQGMEVGGDVESLGRRVTAAVVHAIFSIILIDAVFALIYMELNQ
jgi:phospholipid/cholesterol/gamma-HCH transport system permease protein